MSPLPAPGLPNFTIGQYLKYTPPADDALPEGKLIIPWSIPELVVPSASISIVVVPGIGGVNGYAVDLALQGSNGGGSSTQVSTIKALQFSYQPYNSGGIGTSANTLGRLFIISPMQEVFMFQPGAIQAIGVGVHGNYPTLLNACIQVCTSQNPTFTFVFEEDSNGGVIADIVGQAYNFDRMPYVTYMDNEVLNATPA